MWIGQGKYAFPEGFKLTNQPLAVNVKRFRERKNPTCHYLTLASSKRLLKPVGTPKKASKQSKRIPLSHHGHGRPSFELYKFFAASV
jgi:hypothetical protein